MAECLEDRRRTMVIVCSKAGQAAIRKKAGRRKFIICILQTLLINRKIKHVNKEQQ